MKTILCKITDDNDIERIVGKLASKWAKKDGQHLRIFCVDTQVQKKLEIVGIYSELASGFNRAPTADDERYWEEAYRLSDELRLSAEDEDELKYSGVNFLNLEYDITRYVHLIEFSHLCTQMAEQECKTLIFILNGTYSNWIQDVNTSSIRTLTYGHNQGRLLLLAGLSYSFLRLILRTLRGLTTFTWTYFKNLIRTKEHVYLQDTEQEMQKVLLLVSTMLYVRPAIAICDEFSANGLIPYVATDRPELTPEFKAIYTQSSQQIRAALPMLSLSQIVKVATLTLRLRKLVKMLYKMEKHPENEAQEFSTKYLICRILQNELPLLCIKTAYRIELLERLIRGISPDALILMPDGALLQQLASELAVKYNIPTLACSAAIDTGNARSFMRHLHADKIAAMGEVSKKNYIESGLEPEKIAVTGIAHFDRLFNRDEKQDVRNLASCGIDPEKGYIIFTTDNIDYDETERMLTGVIEAVMKNRDIQLVIKVHPGENIEKYIMLADRYDDSRIIVTKNTDLYTLLSKCEMLITKYSTTALEAMVIDKHVITINLTGIPTPVPYAEEGASLGVYRYEDIEPAINESLYDEETRKKYKEERLKFVRRWAGEPDGKASQRIVSLMKEMIAAKHNTGENEKKTDG
jgi:UDP-N-acetylglucosamine 2-epimerase